VNPMHRDTHRSAGLHLFQELSTLGQQLTRAVLFRQGPRRSIVHVSTATWPDLRLKARVHCPQSVYLERRALVSRFSKQPCHISASVSVRRALPCRGPAEEACT
jgi:hypothetical protein